jgi:hypothetical protein
MKNNRFNIIAIVLGLILGNQNLYSQQYQVNKNAYQLPNGWKISAVGDGFKMGDLPMQLLIHPSKNGW